MRFNGKRYVMASAAAFVFLFATDFLVHGVLLKPIYESSVSLWRPEAECKMWAMILGQILIPFVAAFIFTKGYEGKGVAEGVRFGLLLALLLVPNSLIFYAVQPLPANLVAGWIGAHFVQGIGAGAILALVYRPL